MHSSRHPQVPGHHPDASPTDTGRSRRSGQFAVPRTILQSTLISLAMAGLTACAASDAQTAKGKPSARPPVPVVAVTVSAKTMPLLVQTTGTVKAYSTVGIKSQVVGQLTAVQFQEGQSVEKGDLLFRLDDRNFKATVAQAIANRAKAAAQVTQAQAQLAQARAQVNQAKANMARDLAQAKNADAQAQRYTSLLKEGAVSTEQADQFRTSADAQRAVMQADQSGVGNAVAAVASAEANVQTAIAALQAADAAVASAKVQLSYTAIYAPISGRLGKRNVDLGNLIKDNDATPLVVISQVQPIYVEFAIPQALLPEFRQYQQQGGLQVEAKSPQDNAPAAQGELVFVDSTVDTTTGTLKLKASFPNRDGRLTPGQFVNVVLKLAEEPSAIAVPAPAIQQGQQGSFVYVIQPDKTVAVRPVAVGQTVAGQTRIKTGLQVGDRVVVDGQFGLAPGAPVVEKPGGEKPEGEKSRKGKDA